MLNFKIDKFEGPLDLLLKIVEREEMDITEISLAKITDQYVNYIFKLDQINPEATADFLVLAAKLLLIKSKALLPYLFQDDDEEDVVELESQLKIYKEFLEATKRINKILERKKFMFAREFSKKNILLNNSNIALAGGNIFSPPKKLKISDLRSIYKDLLTRIKPAENKLKEDIVEYKISIEDKIISIQNILINKIKINFNKVLHDPKSKTDIIVSFLALLELIKQKNIAVKQNSLFNEMIICKI